MMLVGGVKMSDILKRINNEKIYDDFIKGEQGTILLKSLHPYLKTIQENFNEFEVEDLYLFRAHSNAIENKLKQHQMNTFVLGIAATFMGLVLKTMVEEKALFSMLMYMVLVYSMMGWVVFRYYRRLVNILLFKEIIEVEIKKREETKKNEQLSEN